MYRRRELIGRICLALALFATSAARAQMADLVATLSARLGITREQAVRGAGAVFGLARQRLSPPEFAIIAESVPGIDRVLDAAPAVGEASGGIDDLAMPFSLLDMPPALIPAFVDVVLGFVAATGGEPVAGLLRRTLFGP